MLGGVKGWEKTLFFAQVLLDEILMHAENRSQNTWELSGLREMLALKSVCFDRLPFKVMVKVWSWPCLLGDLLLPSLAE